MDGGTGASNKSDARTNLGLVIGTDVQPYDEDLADIASLTPNSNNFIYNNNFRLSWIIKDMKCSQNLDYPTVYEPQFSRREVTCNYKLLKKIL